MQFTTLTLLASLTPLCAAAFGDLDCISFESCSNAGCTPTHEAFFVTFDWAADTVALEARGTTYILPAETRNDAQGTQTPGTILHFGNMDDTRRVLRLEAVGRDITGFYSVKDPGLTTLRATCDIRQAA